MDLGACDDGLNTGVSSKGKFRDNDPRLRQVGYKFPS